jgi:hypothetical protein
MLKTFTSNFSRLLSLLGVVAWVALFAASTCLADGLMYKGHINGPHTDLTLTKQQVKVLDSGGKSIRLTSEQRKLLVSRNPKATSVTSLAVYPASIETCTCELDNVAVRISRSTIEVADSCLVWK